MSDFPGDTLVTQRDIEDGLKSLGVRPGMNLLVHSSLSSLGWVCGGAAAVILALERVVSPGGTLMMPTQSTDLSEPSRWSNPPVPEAWWPVIRETMPAYEPDLTPSGRMGVIAETFRKRRGVVRSGHPAVSFAAWGRDAGPLTDGHAPESGLGEGSPLGRLYERGGSVLLLGVGHARNTSLHLAEYRASWPGKRTAIYGNPVLVDGERRWIRYEDLDHDDSDFEEIGGACEARGKGVSTGRIGKARVTLVDQRALVDFAVEWMNDNRR